MFSEGQRVGCRVSVVISLSLLFPCFVSLFFSTLSLLFLSFSFICHVWCLLTQPSCKSLVTTMQVKIGEKTTLLIPVTCREPLRGVFKRNLDPHSGPADDETKTSVLKPHDLRSTGEMETAHRHRPRNFH
ncbi:uncharacterized protein BDW47DRAFT_11526 [Aspergillus candidus]|uniref:Uncharacterized protein n=1 Tax=Aspergillus candidus TaxID=41067 RepID=A0A2I2FGD9_ASPCN|nr:hypothetical protein BDW47DRAFT_11526 [Aspergillus candidus]PLB39689.1 hypothetical protein BDW47DRAFT_11526 [Aspergillus candidus]